MSLTNQDKKWIQDQDNKIFRQLVSYVDQRLYSIEEKLSIVDTLPTKEEFYALADKLLASNERIHAELSSLSKILARHEEEIYQLKNRPIY